MAAAKTITLEGTPVWSRDRRIGHYGGALDKTDCHTEVVPYAWIAYLMLQDMRTSAYSKERGNLVHAENLALARSSAARLRAGEKLATNGIPTTAAERLEYWVEVLRVRSYPDDTRQDMRVRCSAFYKLSRGASHPNVDAAVTELLGTNFVRNWRSRGADLDTPPPQTFSNTVVSGDPLFLYSMSGTYVWLSERAHLTVEVQFIPAQSLSDFLRIMNVELFRLLDRMLPSDMTFNWAIGVEEGFILDVSQLDFTGFQYV